MRENTQTVEQLSTQKTESGKLGQKHISIVWLAGYIDGEGCFTLPPGNRQPSIKISSANYDLLSAIHEQFGGSFYNHGSATNTRRKSWAWTLRGSDAVNLTVKLIPFLREKQNQAVGILAWVSGDEDRNKVLKTFITSEKKTYYEHLEKGQ